MDILRKKNTLRYMLVKKKTLKRKTIQGLRGPLIKYDIILHDVFFPLFFKHFSIHDQFCLLFLNALRYKYVTTGSDKNTQENQPTRTEFGHRLIYHITLLINRSIVSSIHQSICYRLSIHLSTASLYLALSVYQSHLPVPEVCSSLFL